MRGKPIVPLLSGDTQLWGVKERQKTNNPTRTMHMQVYKSHTLLKELGVEREQDGKEDLSAGVTFILILGRRSDL